MASKHLPIGMLAASLLLLGGGCVNSFRAPLKPATGAIVTNYTIPLTTNFEGQSIRGLKKEYSETKYLFLLCPGVDFAWEGRESPYLRGLGARMENIAFMDAEIFTILGIFGSYTVNYYGPAREETAPSKE